MVKVEMKIKGREALQRRLNEKKEQIKNALNMRLMQLAEEAVAYTKNTKGYQDRTGNLKNSTSFALFLDGSLITSSIGIIPKADKVEGGQESVKNALDIFAMKDGIVKQEGYSLIIVAGMNYGKYVEDKGYNVLHLTRYFLRDEMKKILKEVIETVRNEN